MLNMSRVFLEILGAIGGASVIIFGLASWLGKVWAGRILEADRANYNKEVERLKNELNKELESYKCQIDLARLALSRYSENQFNLYNQLWIALSELKIAGDVLWYKVDIDSVLAFSDKLRKTREELLKHALLVEKQHYEQLNKLLAHFSNYMLGKYTLLELDGRNNSTLEGLHEALARQGIIQDNATTKKSYEQLLDLILDSFKEQLKR
jgi:hypothetical protein